MKLNENNGENSTSVAPYNASKPDDVIIYRRVLRVLPGAALGFSQQFMQIELSTRPDCFNDSTLIDAYVESMTGDPLEPSIAAKAGDSALLLRIHHGYSSLLRSINIPVFDNCLLSAPSRNAEAGMLDWRLALPAVNPNISVRVLQWLVSTFNLLLTSRHDKDVRLENGRQELEQLKILLRRYSLSNTNMIHFLRAAYQLRMPFTDLGGGIYAIGAGKNSRWFDSTITEKTPNIGCKMAKNKMASASLLRRFCLPVPDHKMAPTEESAIAIAEEIGYPVVVKPLDQDQGRGVFAGLRNKKSLEIAYRSAREFSEKILVERHHEGEDYRVTVMHDKVIKVMHRKPASVTGDGQSSVRELIEALQRSSEQQRVLRRTGKFRIDLDDEVLGLLEEQGVTLTDIPVVGKNLLLRRKSNISAGGSHAQVPLENIHPDNYALAVRAASILGLDFAGIDLIMPDIALPWHQCEAIICEVNAQPQLGYRDMPELYSRILQEMIRDGGTIPLYLWPIDKEDPPSYLQISSLAQSLGCNTFSTPDGIWRDGVQLAWAPRSSFYAAQSVLLDKETDAALMVVTFDDIVSQGLPAADFQEIDISHPALATSKSWDGLNAKRAMVLIHEHKKRRMKLRQSEKEPKPITAEN